MADNEVVAPTPQIEPQPEALAPQAAAPVSPMPEPPQPQAPAPDAVNVINKDGELVSIPSTHLEDALAQGYQKAPDEMVHEHFLQESHGTPGQQAKALLEGVGEGLTFGASTALEKAAGVQGEDILKRREANPLSHMVGQIASLAIPGAPEAEAVNAAGHAAAAAIPGATAMAKIGSAAAKGAIETMMVQGGDEVSKMIADPNLAPDAAQTALMDVGLAGLMGGTLGGAIGSVSPLWKATQGSKVGSLLKSVSDKLGGIEGQLPDEINTAIQKSGMHLEPEIQAGLSNDPAIQQMTSILNQSDTTKSGRAFQETVKDFRKQAGDAMATSFGKELEAIPEKGSISKYEHGKSIGETLAKEYKAQTDPLVQAYDDIREKYGKTLLEPGTAEKAADPAIAKLQQKASETVEKLAKQAARLQEKGDVEGAIQAAAKVQDAQNELIALQTKAQNPGTIDTIVEKIGQLAQKEGWTASPSSDIMKELGRITNELPNAKTVNDLGNYIKAISSNMQSDPLNGPMRRAGGMIKSILKEAESDLVGRAVGSEEGEAAIEAFAKARRSYAAQSQLKEALDERLHVGGSTSGFDKSLMTMARTDGESVLRRLSGTGDADLLRLLSEKYPETAKLIKDYHINNLLSNAKDGDAIKPERLLKALQGLSPELKGFIAQPGALDRVHAIGSLLEQFNKMPHNFSNTARTMDKLFQNLPGSVVGLASLITGHNPAVSILLGSVTKALTKDVPDAVRLAMLKFLGSGQPIESEGFKSMVDFIHATMKGENLAAKATKNIFKAGSEVLPQSFVPGEKDRNKLDKQLQMLRKDPNAALEIGGKTSHYMPEHGQALSQTVMQAANYLNSIRPNQDPKNPLDTKIPASPAQKAIYNNALDIAQQPLVVLKKLQEGRLSSQDLIHLQNISPNVYTKLQAKLTEQMTDAIAKGEVIPYKTRLGLALFLQQPLDSTMTPNGIMAAQPKPPQAQPGTATQPAQNPKHSTTPLSKMPNAYKTSAQSREERMGKG